MLIRIRDCLKKIKTASIRLVSFLSLLVVLFGLIITYRVWLVTTSFAHQELHNRFDLETTDLLSRINDRIALQEKALLSVVGLFKASDTVERNEFYNFVSAMRVADNYPGMQGLGYSVVVHPEDKNEHIDSVRRDGFLDYNITPEGKRELYTSIIYLEPFDWRNQRAFGYDMFTERVRREAMSKARDTGEATISGKVKLLQESNEKVQPGFLMYVPVYKNRTQNNTIEERRAHILGWVYSPFRMYDLMDGTLGKVNPNLAIRIYDGNVASNDKLLYSTQVQPEYHNKDLQFFSTTLVSINKHDWLVSVSALPAFKATGSWQKPRTVAGKVP